MNNTKEVFSGLAIAFLALSSIPDVNKKEKVEYISQVLKEHSRTADEWTFAWQFVGLFSRLSAGLDE